MLNIPRWRANQIAQNTNIVELVYTTLVYT